MNKKTEITDNGLPKVLSQIITDNVYFLKQRHRVPQTSIANAMHITQSTLNLKLGGKVRWNADVLQCLRCIPRDEQCHHAIRPLSAAYSVRS